MRPGGSAIALLAVVSALAACGGDDEGGQNDSASTGGCKAVSKPRPKSTSFERPGLRLERGERTVAKVKTSCGSFEIMLDTKRSPKTASSFAFLVEEGFYDRTLIHRIVPGFVVQGGDPRGDGTGGPGYSVTEPPPNSIAYRRGIVAMAKTGAEPPGTSGSQFYVVTGADAGLPPEYALLGRVTKGLSVVERIGRLGDPASGEQGAPTETVVIERVTLDRG